MCQGTVRAEGSLGPGDAPQGMVGQELAAGTAHPTPARERGRWGQLWAPPWGLGRAEDKLGT